jgi:hypothetical protein
MKVDDKSERKREKIGFRFFDRSTGFCGSISVSVRSAFRMIDNRLSSSDIPMDGPRRSSSAASSTHEDDEFSLRVFFSILYQAFSLK